MPLTRLQRAAGAFLCGGALALAGCNSDTTPNNTTTITGTAATGAPVTGATVSLRCKGGATASATTNPQGKWSVAVPTPSLPCAVQINAGGVELYSLTIGSGGTLIANLTPLTSLAIAGAAGAAPDDTWFDSLNDSGLETLSTDLAAAITGLASALQTQGYTLPGGTFNPFALAFDAQAGNAWDDLLEALKTALAGAGKDLPALLDDYAAGGDLPLAPDEGGSGGGSCSSGDDKLVFTNYPGDFCGFSREASGNNITDYYQFTSTAGTHGTTYVKFTLVTGTSTVQSLVIENDDYAFSCSSCTGITVQSGSSYLQFTLADTVLAPLFGATADLTVNGLLIHPIPG